MEYLESHVLKHICTYMEFRGKFRRFGILNRVNLHIIFPRYTSFHITVTTLKNSYVGTTSFFVWSVFILILGITTLTTGSTQLWKNKLQHLDQISNIQHMGYSYALLT